LKEKLDKNDITRTQTHTSKDQKKKIIIIDVTKFNEHNMKTNTTNGGTHERENESERFCSTPFVVDVLLQHNTNLQVNAGGQTRWHGDKHSLRESLSLPPFNSRAQ
jgi:hypothetical protein